MGNAQTCLDSFLAGAQPTNICRGNLCKHRPFVCDNIFFHSVLLQRKTPLSPGVAAPTEFLKKKSSCRTGTAQVSLLSLLHCVTLFLKLSAGLQGLNLTSILKSPTICPSILRQRESSIFHMCHLETNVIAQSCLTPPKKDFSLGLDV